jgi:hypothetical protein
MNAIRRLCTKSLLLNEGKLVAYGDTESVIEQYLSTDTGPILTPNQRVDLLGRDRDGTGRVRFAAIACTSYERVTNFHPFTDGSLEFTLDVICEESRDVSSIAVSIYDQYGTKLINADTFSQQKAIHFVQGYNYLKIHIKELHLNPGIYTVGLWAADPPSEVYDAIAAATKIEIIERHSDRVRVQKDGAVSCDFEVMMPAEPTSCQNGPLNREGHLISA